MSVLGTIAIVNANPPQQIWNRLSTRQVRCKYEKHVRCAPGPQQSAQQLGNGKVRRYTWYVTDETRGAESPVSLFPQLLRHALTGCCFQCRRAEVMQRVTVTSPDRSLSTGRSSLSSSSFYLITCWCP